MIFCPMVVCSVGKGSYTIAKKVKIANLSIVCFGIRQTFMD